VGQLVEREQPEVVADLRHGRRAAGSDGGLQVREQSAVRALLEALDHAHVRVLRLEGGDGLRHRLGPERGRVDVPVLDRRLRMRSTHEDGDD
jgi:hypothetical protein